MAGNTSPDNITYPVGGDKVAPLNTVLATMASTMQTAITNRFNGAGVYRTYDTKTLLNAAPGTIIGQHAMVNADATNINNGDYRWDGSAWKAWDISGPWITVASEYKSGWSAYTTGGWAGIRYRYIVTAGVPSVRITGAMTKSSAWSSGEVTFTLPTGYRPTSNVNSVSTVGIASVTSGGDYKLPAGISGSGAITVPAIDVPLD